MDHLSYQHTNNKAFKAYYDKFKKMVKQDLKGDGWFLLVKDFPFKDGPNLMFTAGEDIGKWPDKNLVSLYGKTKYIIGRCRKKGPVLTLLHFQDGDYVKEATESGLRKELKEYFKGTGVSVRSFKSLKVTDQEPELEEEQGDTSGPEVIEDSTSESTTSFEELEMPKLTPTSLKATLDKAIAYATDMGVVGEDDFVNRVNAFKKAVPNMARMKGALANLNDYLANVEPTTSEEPSASTGEETDVDPQKIAKIKEIEGLNGTIEALQTEVSELEKTLTAFVGERRALHGQIESLRDQYSAALKDVSSEGSKNRFSLARQLIEIIRVKVPKVKSEFSISKKDWEKKVNLLIEKTKEVEKLEASINT